MIKDEYPFPKGEIHDHGEIFDAVTDPSGDTEKKGRGGRREGAGRKRVYGRYDTERLKCKKIWANVVRAFISLLDNNSEIYDKMSMQPCMLDGDIPELKFNGFKMWQNGEAICSEFSILVGTDCDYRIFLLAFHICRPQGVRVHIDNRPDQSFIKLIWQRIDEVSRVMSMYGYLLARKDRLDNNTRLILEDMPSYFRNQIDWANNEYNE